MLKSLIADVKILFSSSVVKDFAKVDFNSPFVQIESNSMSSKLTCGPKCDLSCLSYALVFILYPICVASCMKECHKTPIDIIYNCLTGCDMVKSIHDNVDIHYLITLVSFKDFIIIFIIQLITFLHVFDN